MGVIFHRYQRETPETSGPDGSRSYITASLQHVLAAIGIACLFTLVVRFKVGIFTVDFRGVLLGHLHLGCAGAADSSRIRPLSSSPSPCCHRPTTRLAHDFRARLRQYMVVAQAITP
jgi:hypothetical protein